MKKARKYLALTAIAVLALMYIILFISALMKSEAAAVIFRMCLAATIALPITLYTILLIMKVLDRSDKNSDSSSGK